MEKPVRLKLYKNASPIETIHTIRKILFENNIFLIESVHKKDSLTGICSCRVIIGNDNIRDLNIGSNGKGMNTEYALASAYAEFIERFQNGALFWKLSGITSSSPGSFSVAKKDFIIITKKFIKLVYGELKDNDDILSKYIENLNEFKVISLNEYQSENKVLLPVELFNRMTGSNGMASGNTMLEAIIQGLSEIFERYVIQELFLNKMTPPQIDIKYFEGTEILERIKKLENRGIKYKILDCSLGKGLPVIGLLLEKNNKYHIHFGADPSPITALERCLTETLQGRSVDEIPLLPLLKVTADKKVLFENEKKEYTDSTGQVPMWILYSEYSWPFNGFVHNVSMTDEDDMRYYLKILSDLDKKLYVHENSFLGFPSVRLYVPGMTENHCPYLELCIEKSIPIDLEKLLNRLPILTNEEYKKLAYGIKQWLKTDYEITNMNKFVAKELTSIKKVFPIGIFPVKWWDERLLIAAIFIRGGIIEDGNKLLNIYISENKVNEQEAKILKLRLFSQSLTFLNSEWPQCPNCDVCQAKHLCYQDIVNRISKEYSILLNK